MPLLDAFLLDAAPLGVFISARTDRNSGVGTAQDPLNGSTKRGVPIPIALKLTADPSSREAEAILLSPSNIFVEGDIITISGVTGTQTDPWNGTFGIYNVSATGFNYLMLTAPLRPQGKPVVARLTFPIDKLLRDKLLPSARIQLGPGTFQTRGFAQGDARGFQAQSGWKIVGAGVDATVLQLVGADQADSHYHIIGMGIEPTGSAPIPPLQGFEISNLTFDANMDNQPGRPTPGYANVACGAVRILGNNCRISNVKAINWGTKSLKQGCFVFSIIDATGRPTGTDGQPILTETVLNGIEDCIALQPSKNCIRETTVFHIGGLKNPDNQARAFARAPFIRRNFLDGQFFTSADGTTPPAVPFPSAFITSKIGTQIIGNTGTFIGKRPHFRGSLDVGSYMRFYNPRDPLSRWNGYFPIVPLAGFPDTLLVDLTTSAGSNDNSDFVVMGTEFRGIAVASGINALISQNQIHNCWIGTYQSPLDDSVTDPTVPPTLAREEHLDPLNALNTRSMIVRSNVYKAVAVGPHFNMGGVSGAVGSNTVGYNATTGEREQEDPAHRKMVSLFFQRIRSSEAFATTSSIWDSQRLYARVPNCHCRRFHSIVWQHDRLKHCRNSGIVQGLSAGGYPSDRAQSHLARYSGWRIPGVDGSEWFWQIDVAAHHRRGGPPDQRGMPRAGS